MSKVLSKYILNHIGVIKVEKHNSLSMTIL